VSRRLRRPRFWLRGGLLALLPWFGPPGDAYRALEAGNALYRAGQYEAALGEYALAAAVLPDAPEIEANRGNAWFRRFDYDQALAHYHEALGTVDPFIASRVRYNIGVVKYQQALEALETFQDALTETREAIDYFRESLRLDPALHDARYNLELAYELLQRIQRQRDAGTRDQKTSGNRGQSLAEQASEEQADGRDAEADTGDQQKDATSAPPGPALSRAGNQLDRSRLPPPMSPEAAERLLEMLRARSEVSQSFREAQQRARMREAGLAKTW
jgi:Ca-activated chloride channel homolog